MVEAWQRQLFHRAGRSNLYVQHLSLLENYRDRPLLLQLHAWPALETLYEEAQAKGPNLAHVF